MEASKELRWNQIQKNKVFRFYIHSQQLTNTNYYSGKYEFHCVKMQVAVGPQGVAVDIKGPYIGSVHDFIFLQQTNTKKKKKYLVKEQDLLYLIHKLIILLFPLYLTKVI